MKDSAITIDSRAFLGHMVFISVVLGTISCVLTIIDTLLNPWIPQISSGQWWYIVGSLTVFFLMVAAIGSMIGVSKTEWQVTLKQ